MNARTPAAFLQTEWTEGGAQDDVATRMASRAFAHAHSVHQDFLVQAYRLLVAAMHLGFVCAFTGLLVARLPVVVTLTAAAAGFFAQRSLSQRLMDMVFSRQRDVDWSQLQVLVLEQQLAPALRQFTKFKLYQDAKSGSVAEKERAVMVAQPATVEQVEAYFLSHSSPSRGKASKLLDGMRLLGAGLAVLAVVSSFLP